MNVEVLAEPIVIFDPWAEAINELGTDDLGEKIVCLLDVRNREPRRPGMPVGVSLSFMTLMYPLAVHFAIKTT